MFQNYSYILDNVLAQGGKPPINAAICPKFTTLVLTAQEIIADPRYRDPAAFKPCTVLYVPLDDAKPTQDELKIAIVAAHNIAARIRSGQRVLVTCHMGLNRSGLINALTLINLGFTADQAIQRIRSNRGSTALRNTYFVRAIHSYGKLVNLDQARPII